jgi:hypothetical protein
VICLHIRECLANPYVLCSPLREISLTIVEDRLRNRNRGNLYEFEISCIVNYTCLHFILGCSEENYVSRVSCGPFPASRMERLNIRSVRTRNSWNTSSCIPTQHISCSHVGNDLNTQCEAPAVELSSAMHIYAGADGSHGKYSLQTCPSGLINEKPCPARKSGGASSGSIYCIADHFSSFSSATHLFR